MTISYDSIPTSKLYSYISIPAIAASENDNSRSFLDSRVFNHDAKVSISNIYESHKGGVVSNHVL